MGNERETQNLTDKTLKEFSAGDSLYISKTHSGTLVTLECKFVSLKGGVVTAEIVGVAPGYYSHYWAGTVTARATKCYLWGARPGELSGGRPWVRCHWFKDTKTKAN